MPVRDKARPFDLFHTVPSFTAWPRLKGKPEINPTPRANAANQISATLGYSYAKHACRLISAGFVWLCAVLFRLDGEEITFRGWGDKREVHYLLPSRRPASFVYCFHSMLLGMISEHKIQNFPAVQKLTCLFFFFYFSLMLTCWHFYFPFVHGKVCMHSALCRFFFFFLIYFILFHTTLDDHKVNAVPSNQHTHCLLSYNSPLAHQSLFGS